ncbi:MAG TPA: hypothetical protein VN642_06395 [Dongiaceae bacterium]|nr:hypothetical protein [Dongiaceae bacterium]
MNNAMSSHTQRLATKLAFAIVLFVTVSTALAVLSRYRQNLAVIDTQHRMIPGKLDLMRRVTAEEREAITRFKQLLPPDYGANSPEWFIYSRLDEIKSRFALQDMTVGEIQTKDGARTAHFSMKIPHSDYSQVLNRVALLETELFPFVSINSIAISNQSGESALNMTVEGDVIMPAMPEKSPQTRGGADKP